MGILRIDHPDILEFITCKDKNNKLNNFNISVAITDSFMRAVIEDKEYDLINPRTKRVVGSLKAKEVFQMIDQAYRYRRPRGGARYQLLFPLVRVNFELGVIMVMGGSCVKLLSAHNSTQHTSRKHKV
jgi:Ribonucleotide reductase, alpha subunit